LVNKVQNLLLKKIKIDFITSFYYFSIVLSLIVSNLNFLIVSNFIVEHGYEFSFYFYTLDFIFSYSFVLLTIILLFIPFFLKQSNPLYILISFVFFILLMISIFISSGLESIPLLIAIVYVGAISVLFLFIVMLLDIRRSSSFYWPTLTFNFFLFLQTLFIISKRNTIHILLISLLRFFFTLIVDFCFTTLIVVYKFIILILSHLPKSLYLILIISFIYFVLTDNFIIKFKPVGFKNNLYSIYILFMASDPFWVTWACSMSLTLMLPWYFPFLKFKLSIFFFIRIFKLKALKTVFYNNVLKFFDLIDILIIYSFILLFLLTIIFKLSICFLVDDMFLYLYHSESDMKLMDQFSIMLYDSVPLFNNSLTFQTFFSYNNETYAVVNQVFDNQWPLMFLVSLVLLYSLIGSVFICLKSGR
jgi:NADH:ubiquinone oxidoreductase subunit 6 (subunit J)